MCSARFCADVLFFLQHGLFGSRKELDEKPKRELATSARVVQHEQTEDAPVPVEALRSAFLIHELTAFIFENGFIDID
jgi:hypothetical protein